MSLKPDWTRGFVGHGGRNVLGLVVALLAIGCGGGQPEPDRYEPLVPFDTVAARILTDTGVIELTVEVADTDERRAYGMMERAELPERHGMIFTYPAAQEPDQPFWMYRTLLALDIAFLDDAGRIVAIRAMDPCPSPNPQVCRRYAPGVAYHSALEVGQGLLDRWGVELGDQVQVGEPAPED